MTNGWWCKTCKAFVVIKTRRQGYQTLDVCSTCGGGIEWKNEELKDIAGKKIDDGGHAFR